MKVTPVISDFTRGELSPRMEGRSDSPVFFQGVSELQNFIVLPQGGVEKRPGTKYFTTAKYPAKQSRLIPFVINEDLRFVLELYDGGIRAIKNDAGTLTILDTQYVITLDVAPAVDWAVGATLTGGTSGTTAIILQKNSSTEYAISEPSGSFTLDENLTADDVTGTPRTASQGAAHPTVATNSNGVVADGSTTFFTESELFSVKYVQVSNQMVLTHPNHEPKVLNYYDDNGWLLATLDVSIPVWVPYEALQ